MGRSELERSWDTQALSECARACALTEERGITGACAPGEADAYAHAHKSTNA